MPSRQDLPHRAAARAAARRTKRWWDVASWATTLLIVLGVGAVVHWRVTSVLDEDRRLKQAEAAYAQALRTDRSTPEGLDRAADRFRAIIADYPDTEFARKAEQELARIEQARAARGQPPRPTGGTP